jgi:hypothetical protein
MPGATAVILFTDLVDSTAIGARIGAYEPRDIREGL